MKPLYYSNPVSRTESSVFDSVLRSGLWTNGPVVQEFEAAIAKLAEADHVIATSSGSTAIYALLSLLRRGKSLLVTSALNFAAGPAAAALLGFDLALTDIDEHMNMDPESLAEVLASHASRFDTIIVMPVHFAGRSADMARISKVASDKRAVVVEDACHALGARYADGRAIGSHPSSLAAVFSFHPTKPVSSGEGGAIATSSTELAQRLRLQRNHNIERNEGPKAEWLYDIETPSSNFRLSEIHAALGLSQIVYARQDQGYRSELANRYAASLSDIAGITLPSHLTNGYHAWHLYVVRFDMDRLGMSEVELYKHFRERDIVLQRHYVPLIDLTAFGDALVPPSGLPEIDRIRDTYFSIPLSKAIDQEAQGMVIDAFRDLIGGVR